MKQELEFDRYQQFEPLLTGSLVQPNAGYYFFKRLLDIVVSATVLIVFSPFLLLIAILIMIDSRGSAFFVQERVGSRRLTNSNFTRWENVPFRIYKFRTMITNADPSIHKAYVQALIKNDNQGMAAIQGEDTQVRKLIHDPRVTRVGRILRKTSLDELPQFWNVLRGDMTLVGPRPPIPYEVEMYQPWHYQRLQAKPGLTGLWQITERSSADFDDMVQKDIEYVQSQNFWLDFMIIIKTPAAAISTKGAH